MTYYTIWTDEGLAKLAAAELAGTKVVISHMAIGDGSGSEYEPVSTQTALVNELERYAVNDRSENPENAAQAIIEGIVPEEDGGWTVREVGLVDEDGDLVGIAKYPPTYKPDPAEGAASDLVIRLVMEYTNLTAIDLVIDPAVAVATQEYVAGLVYAGFLPKTADYTVVAGDAGQTVVFDSAAVADATFTLPDCGEDDDGKIFNFINDSDYSMLVKPQDGYRLWRWPVGLETSDIGAAMSVKYRHAAATFVVLPGVLGKWMVEGLRIYVPFDQFGSDSIVSGEGFVANAAGGDFLRLNTVNMIDGSAGIQKFGPACMKINAYGASGQFAKMVDYPDFDLFAAATEDFTLAFWLRFWSTAAYPIMCHYQDASNYWKLSRSAAIDNYINLAVVVGGSTVFGLSGATTVVQSPWVHIALVFKASTQKMGLYIDGEQDAAASFTAATPASLAGFLFLGTDDGSANFMQGHFDDIVLARANIFGADPDPSGVDSFTPPARAFKGVIN